jgi:hypothetical protein
MSDQELAPAQKKARRFSGRSCEEARAAARYVSFPSSSDVFSLSFYTWARIELYLEAQNTCSSDFLKKLPSPISIKTPSRAHNYREKDQKKTSEEWGGRQRVAAARAIGTSKPCGLADRPLTRDRPSFARTTRKSSVKEPKKS